MSNFSTSLPVDLDRFKSLLPPGSTVEHLELDEANGCLKIIWRNPGLQTPYSWPWPWNLGLLEQKAVPDGVAWPGHSERDIAEAFVRDALNPCSECGGLGTNRSGNICPACGGTRLEPLRPATTKGLTVTPDKTIPKASEKVARKIKKLLGKGKSRASANTSDDSTADASSVDGPGPGSTGGVSDKHGGE